MKKLSIVIISIFLLLTSSGLFAQNVSINADGSLADTSAMLDVGSTTKGFLLPRMTTTQQNSIVLPANGLTIFNTTLNSIMLNTGTPLSPLWLSIANANNGWSITGNTAINPVSNFIGTTDNNSLRFRTNNIQRMKIDSIGNIAIGQDAFDATNPEKMVINAGKTNSVNVLALKGSINNYLQMNIQNSSNGNNATSDIVATADNGNETSNYVDLGINGSNYAGSAIQTGVANDGYLISAGNDFYLVNSSSNKNLLFLTGGTGVANERMRILANGYVGLGVQDPAAQFVVKDTIQIRRTGAVSQLLFTNTAGTGDFRIGGDGGDIFWQGGGGRDLQMGSYWSTILTGDRQTATYPAFISNTSGTGVIVLGQRDASVPLGVQANSATQSANLTEWRNSSGTVLSAIDKNGNLGVGTSAPSTRLQVIGTNPLNLLGVQLGTNTSTDSVLTISSGVVKKLPTSTFSTGAPSGTAGGDLSGTYPNPTVAAGVINNSKLATMAANTFKANNTGSTGSPLDITGTQATAMLDNFTSATKGLVPLSGGGTTTYLRADGTWATLPAALGTWSLTGNSGTTSSTNFIGTTDYKSFKIKTNNTQGFILDSLGNVGIGTSPSFSSSNPEKLLVDAGSVTYNVISGKGNLNNYLQLNIKNSNSGTSASSDVVATNDAGTEANGINYIDMGVNSSGYSSGGILGGANNAYLYATGNDFIIGNSTASMPLRFYTTNSSATSGEAMRIDPNGNLGIGNTSPAQKLDVNGNFKLSGAFMPAGLAGTSGYFLQSLGAGTAPQWVDESAYAWQLNGNSVASIKTLGTITNYDLPFITNNTEKMRITSAGSVGVGTSIFNTTYPEKFLVDAGSSGNTNYQNVVVGKGNTNSYAQLNIQNNNAGTNASSDVVATSDNGNESVNYIDMGVNSSANTTTGVIGGANTGYLYTTGNDFAIGNATASKNLIFFTGGTTSNERMRVDGNGNVGINTTTPAAKLDISGTYKLGAAGTTLTNMIKTSVSFTDNNTFIYSSPTHTNTVTVTGASTNATVIVNPRGALPQSVSIAWALVSSANNVTIGFVNADGTARSLGTVTFDITIIQ